MKLKLLFFGLFLFSLNTIYAQVTVSTFAGSGSPGTTDGTGTAASFRNPYGAVLDSNGNLFIADTFNELIRKITPSGVVTTFAGTGTAATIDGTGTAASFMQPFDITIDTSDNLYVVEGNGRAVRKVTPSAVVTTIAGNGSLGATNGMGNIATFNSPRGIAIDNSGNLFIADSGNSLIRKITPVGIVSTFAGTGVAGSADGTGTSASFNSPLGLTVDSSGNIYVADTNNHKIRKITPSGVVTTFAGSGVSGSADGNGTAAQFNGPVRIQVSNTGTMYIGGFQGHNIRTINASGDVVTLAGTGSIGSVDGAALSSSFNYPTAIAIDSSEDLFVVDTNNHKIRKITQNIAILATHLNFDGINDQVNLGSSLSSEIDALNTITVEANIRPSTLSGLGVVFGNYAYPTDNGQAQTFIRRDGTGYTFFVDDGVSLKAVNAPGSAQLNTWTHVAGVWNGSDIKIYINGTLVNTTTGVTGSSFKTLANSFVIGFSLAGAPDEAFGGDIDEVRVWNHARTSGQINNSKACEIQGNESGLLRYYKFNQGAESANNTSETTLLEGTSSTNDGTLTNFSLNGVTSNWVDGSPIVTGSSCMTLNVSKFENNATIKLFPNPTSGNVSIALNSNNTAQLYVYDINGRMLIEQDLNANSNRINVSNFVNGVYVFKIKMGESIIIKRVVKN